MISRYRGVRTIFVVLRGSVPHLPGIGTDRLLLRPFDGSEAHWLYELDNDPEVMRHINGGTHTPLEFIKCSSLPFFCKADWPVPETGFWKVLSQSTQEPLGWCCLRVADASLDTGSLGYRLQRTAWGNGYASEASRALLEHGFSRLDLARVKATTYEENVRSRRVLEKLGFRLIREYREDLDSQQTANFDGSEAFPGLDLEFELRKQEWLQFSTTNGS